MPTPAPVEPTPVPTTEAPATTITSTSTTSSAAPTQPSNPYLVDADLSQISAFKANTGGWNTNSLVSWFRTNNAADDTNVCAQDSAPDFVDLQLTFLPSSIPLLSFRPLSPPFPLVPCSSCAGELMVLSSV